MHPARAMQDMGSCASVKTSVHVCVRGVEGHGYYASHTGLRARTCTVASYSPSTMDLHVRVCPYLHVYGPVWLCTCMLMDWRVRAGCGDVLGSVVRALCILPDVRSSPWPAAWHCSSTSLSCESSDREVHWRGCMSEWVRVHE